MGAVQVYRPGSGWSSRQPWWVLSVWWPRCSAPEVPGAGGAALLPRGGVVQVAALGGPGAGGEPAGLVAGDDVLGQLRRRQVPAAADVEDHTGDRVGEQPAPDTVRGDPPGDLGADRSVALQVGGLVVGADQRRIGHVTFTGRRPRRPASRSPTWLHEEWQQPRCPAVRADQPSPASTSARAWSRVRLSPGSAVWWRRAAASMAVQNAAASSRGHPQEQAGHPVGFRARRGHEPAGPRLPVPFGGAGRVRRDDRLGRRGAQLGGGLPVRRWPAASASTDRRRPGALRQRAGLFGDHPGPGTRRCAPRTVRPASPAAPPPAHTPAPPEPPPPMGTAAAPRR